MSATEASAHSVAATPEDDGRGRLVGGPGYAETSHDGLSTLRLHAGIAVIATVLCLFVTAIFIGLGTIWAAIVFAVLAIACVGIALGASARIRRGRAEQNGH